MSLRRRREAYPLFHLQLRLLQDMLVAQQTIHAIKAAGEESAEPEGEHRGPADKGGADEDGEEPEYESDEEIAVRHNQSHIAALREIGDGIAWRLFDYDRGLLYMLASRPDKGHVDVTGLGAELREFAGAFDSGEGIPIFNDATHFLKLGDVTVCRPDGGFDIREIKKSPQRSRRVTRQKQAMAQVVTLFNEGSVQTPEETLFVRVLDVTPQTYLPQLERLLLEAERQGAASERVGDHLFVSCADFTSARVDRGALRAVRDAEREVLHRWGNAGDFAIAGDNFDRRFVRNIAPVSIFPIQPHLRVKLMTRAMVYRTAVNLSAVFRYLHQRGWDIVKRPETAAAESQARGDLRRGTVGTIAKGRFKMDVPPALVARLMDELLRPRTLHDILSAMFEDGPRGEDAVLPVLSGEATIWD